MKLLILFGLIALAAAYPTVDVQQVSSNCVILEYDLGYTKVEFQACQTPHDCLKAIDICPSNRQLTPIGAGQFIFLGGPSTGFRPYTIQLFGGTGLKHSFCLRASPTLKCCNYGNEEIEAQQEDDDVELPGMFCTRPAEGGPKTCRPINPTGLEVQY